MTIRSKQWYTNISRLPNSFVNVSIGRLPCSRLTTRSSDRRPVVSKFQIFLARIDALVVAEDSGAAAIEVVCPESALACLEAVFGFHGHKLTCIYKLLKQCGDLLLQLWPMIFQIADEQVHQCFGVRPDAVVSTRRAGKFADEEDQGAQAGTE